MLAGMGTNGFFWGYSRPLLSIIASPPLEKSQFIAAPHVTVTEGGRVTGAAALQVVTAPAAHALQKTLPCFPYQHLGLEWIL